MKCRDLQSHSWKYMVLAYWLIGREIVQELQGGEVRAEYGKQVVENLVRSIERQVR